MRTTYLALQCEVVYWNWKGMRRISFPHPSFGLFALVVKISKIQVITVKRWIKFKVCSVKILRFIVTPIQP
jgi:hypothetical protein